MNPTPEQERLAECSQQKTPWKKWGPYLSERQWGTVREDYSEDGNAWKYFTHDQARSRAYRWGEDGIAGFSDDKQRLCWSLGLWNGKDPILKERLFGLDNSEGNHGEDVKEYYYYLDSTPTHSYMKFLYKYPHAAYPYDKLVKTNQTMGRDKPEYELIDTGIFKDDRYFDIFVEYAKEGPEDVLIQIRVINRGSTAADLHLLPTVWFRNTWSWNGGTEKPKMRQAAPGTVEARHPGLGTVYFHAQNAESLLFTENETNQQRLFKKPNASPYVKDAFHDYVIQRKKDAVNPKHEGTKAAAYYHQSVPAQGEWVVCLRLTPQKDRLVWGPAYDKIVGDRLAEADAFYAAALPPASNDDERRVMRQAFAGMLWTKQYYFFELDSWLAEHGSHKMTPERAALLRNAGWEHMVNDDIISMPDKWEYPWYAAWDLAFHTSVLSAVDPDFAKQQLNLMLEEIYLHPNGQIPAYEWNFGDVNPPVHAWATWFMYDMEKARTGQGDLTFLKSAFHKLLLNFTWWVNRKDRSGKSVFEGGFLGLDNIGVFDRSRPLPTGGYLEQADGTAWMAFYSQMMLKISLELAEKDPIYGEMAMKFFDHCLLIAAAIDRPGEHHDEMWDEEDGFFYDVLRFPDGNATRLKVRSLVGLLPLCAVSVVERSTLDKFPELVARARKRLDRMPQLKETIENIGKKGEADRAIFALVDEKKLRRILARLLDEKEFLSAYGIRSLSRYHADHPYVYRHGSEEFKVGYLPGDSDNGMFGGNSNWRGPIWMPTSALIIRALMVYYGYYGNKFQVECPTGSGKMMNLYEVAQELTRRSAMIFLRDKQGRRAFNGDNTVFQKDPNWKDLVLFYEYFHGDTGAGIGASHQTGWTGLIARLMQVFAVTSPDDVLKEGRVKSRKVPAAKA